MPPHRNTRAPQKWYTQTHTYTRYTYSLIYAITDRIYIQFCKCCASLNFKHMCVCILCSSIVFSFYFSGIYTTYSHNFPILSVKYFFSFPFKPINFISKVVFEAIKLKENVYSRLVSYFLPCIFFFLPFYSFIFQVMRCYT